MKSEFAAPVLCIAVFVMALTVNLLGDDIPGVKESPVLTSVVLQLLIFAMPAVFFCRLRPETCSAEYLRLKLVSPDCFMFTVYALIVVVAGCALIRCGVYTVFPTGNLAGLQGGAATASFQSDTADVSLGLFNSITLYAVLPALTEEFLFRSVIMGEYLDSGVLTASFISSLMFAMAHFSLPMFPVYFFSGLILALTAAVTGSVFASMTVHAANNVLTLFFDAYLKRLLSRSTNTVIFVIIAAAVMLLFMALMFSQAQRVMGRRSVYNKPTPVWVTVKRETVKQGAHPFISAVASPAFIILAAFFVIISLAI